VAVREVLHYPDQRLKQVSASVITFDSALQGVLKDLEDTMRASPGCVGLAAPQIGHFQRAAIVDVGAKPGIAHNGCLLLVNPEIVRREGGVIGREGCLSVPDYTGNVARAERVCLRAQNGFGQWQQYDCEGYEARAVLHEVDHLDGLLFLDRLVSKRDLFRRKAYRK